MKSVLGGNILNYRPYESFTRRLGRRNRGNELAILAAGFCAFISSFIANMATSENETFTIKMFLAPMLAVLLYLVAFWIYGKCYGFILNRPALRKAVFGGLHREDMTHIISLEIPSVLSHLLERFSKDVECKELLIAEAQYEISNILEFISLYSKDIYTYKPKRGVNRAPASFISIITINAIFNSIDLILSKCIISSDTEKAAEKAIIDISNNSTSALKDKSTNIKNALLEKYNITE